MYHALNSSRMALMGEAKELVPESVRILSAFILLGFSVNPLRFYIKKLVAPKRENRTFMRDFPLIDLQQIQTGKGKERSGIK